MSGVTETLWACYWESRTSLYIELGARARADKNELVINQIS
jgi:hypothetical protein